MSNAAAERNNTITIVDADGNLPSSEPPVKCSGFKLPAKAAEDTYELLLHLMETRKLFLDPNLTLDYLAYKMSIHYSESTPDRLADETKIHRNTLSHLINHHRKSNFNDFINSYRVEEAKRILCESMRRRSFVKMWRIYTEAGFKSKSTFYRNFKRFIGCTPFEYKVRMERA